MRTKKNDLTYLYGAVNTLYSIPKRSICGVDAEGFPTREAEAIAAHPGFRSTINLV